MIDLFIEAALIQNLALAFFLGICTLFGGSRRVLTAFGLGIAIIVVLLITVALNHVVYHQLLAPGAWRWAGMPDLDLTHLSLICFIGLIAASVQVLEMVLDRYFPSLFRSLGLFLPLITVNCAILGSSLFMVERRYSFTQSIVFALGGGVGWALAVTALAAIRERIEVVGGPGDRHAQAKLFVVVGIMSMAYLAFSGVQLS